LEPERKSSFRPGFIQEKYASWSYYGQAIGGLMAEPSHSLPNEREDRHFAPQTRTTHGPYPIRKSQHARTTESQESNAREIGSFEAWNKLRRNA
jgi:hypothetical protein